MARVWSGVTEQLTGDSIPAISELYGRPFFVGIGSKSAGVHSFDKYSDIRGRIGYGPLTRLLEDFFVGGGQESKAFAKVLDADDPGSIGAIVHTGSGNGRIILGGAPWGTYDVHVEILTTGGPTTATYRVSIDGGSTWVVASATATESAASIPGTGMTIKFVTGGTPDFVDGDLYTTATVAGTVGSVTRTGTGLGTITVTGTPRDAYDVQVEITSSGTTTTAVYRVSLDGGATWAVSGVTATESPVAIPTTGLSLTFVTGGGSPDFVDDDVYDFATTAGTIGTITHVGAGLGSIVLAGTPYDRYNVLVEILSDGSVSTATYKVSIDGGESWVVTRATASGTPTSIPTTGMTIQFVTGGGSPDFEEGDTYSAVTTAPTCDNSTILAAMDSILDDYRGRFEFFVIQGPASDSFWTSVATVMTTEFNNHNPIFTLLESQTIEAATKDADIAALIEDAAAFSSRFVAVVTAEVAMANAVGEVLPRSPIGFLAGILSKGKVSDSVGVIRDEFGLIRSGTALSPDTLTLGDLELLADAGFTVPRWYEGYPGLYFNNGSIMSAPGDPFDDIEKIRVAGKMIRLCRIAALRCLHLDADSTAEWAFGGRSGLKYLEAELQRAVDPMIVAGEVYRFQPHVISTPDEVYDTSSVTVRLDFTTNPKMKAIELVFDLVSPDEFARRNG